MKVFELKSQLLFYLIDVYSLTNFGMFTVLTYRLKIITSVLLFCINVWRWYLGGKKLEERHSGEVLRG